MCVDCRQEKVHEMYVAPHCCCAGGGKWSEDVLRGRLFERPAQRWRGRRWCREQKEQSSAPQMWPVWHTENDRFAQFILSTRDRLWRICRYSQGSTSWHPGTSLKGWTMLPNYILGLRARSSCLCETGRPGPGMGGERQGDHLSCLQKHVLTFKGAHTDAVCLPCNCQSSHAENRELSFLSSLSVKWVCIMGFQRHDSL